MEEIKGGIYLELKKGVIGTGHTAKTEEYRNFWMTIAQNGQEVECVLLNNDFKPTGYREKIPLAEFAGQRFTYVPQGEKRYRALLAQITPTPRVKKEVPSDPTPAQPEKTSSPKWWEGQSKDIKPGDLFKRDESGRPKSAPAASTNWWEAGSTKVTTEDIFKKPETPAKKSSKPQAGQNVKKTWWDK